jgi:hypothetical protein
MSALLQHCNLDCGVTVMCVVIGKKTTHWTASDWHGKSYQLTNDDYLVSLALLEEAG